MNFLKKDVYIFSMFQIKDKAETRPKSAGMTGINTIYERIQSI